MKNLFAFLIIFLSLFLIIKMSQITVTAYSGGIEKTIDKKEGIFTFLFEVKVDGNITSNLSKTEITLKLSSPKKTDGTEGEAKCKIEAVRVTSSEPADTNLNCEIPLNDYTGLSGDTDIMLSQDPTHEKFIFVNFGEISKKIVITKPTLSYNKTTGCKSNNYIFTMNAESIDPHPLLATKFTINLTIANDDNHKTAICALPAKLTKLMCYIDVEENKLNKGQKITFAAQEGIDCENGQSAKIDASENELEVVKNCGEEINNDSNWRPINIILFVLSLLLIS